MAMAKALGSAVGAYWKPSVGKIVLRKPHSNQTSEDLLDQQDEFAEHMEGNNIAGECKGKDWNQFKACLRKEGKSAW